MPFPIALNVSDLFIGSSIKGMIVITITLIQLHKGHGVNFSQRHAAGVMEKSITRNCWPQDFFYCRWGVVLLQQ
jgi:hypothetical protein